MGAFNFTDKKIHVEDAEDFEEHQKPTNQVAAVISPSRVPVTEPQKPLVFINEPQKGLEYFFVKPAEPAIAINQPKKIIKPLFDQIYVHPDSPIARARARAGNSPVRSVFEENESEIPRKPFPPEEFSAPMTGGLRPVSAPTAKISGFADDARTQPHQETGDQRGREIRKIFEFYAMYLMSAKTNDGVAYYHKDKEQEILFHKKVSGDDDAVVETTKNPDDMSEEEIGAMILVAKEAFARHGNCDIEVYGTTAFIEKVKVVAEKIGVSVSVAERQRQRG